MTRISLAASSLPHPYLEYISTLTLSSASTSGSGSEPYPALILPNVTELSLALFPPRHQPQDVFSGFIHIFPGMNPTRLSLDFASDNSQRNESRYPTFVSYIDNWTRLDIIDLACYYEYEQDNETPPTVAMDALLYESVTLLEALPMLEKLQPKVVFEWRFLKDPSTDDDGPMMPPMADCPLARLPGWMRFEIVIDLGSSWLKKDNLEEWLDACCQSAEQMSDRRPWWRRWRRKVRIRACKELVSPLQYLTSFFCSL